MKIMTAPALAPARPMLYKYRAPITDLDFRRIEEMITEGKYFFSSPKNFNDVFDLKPVLSFACTDLEYIKGYIKIAKRKRDFRSREKIIKEAQSHIGTDNDARSEVFSRRSQDNYHKVLDKWGVLCLADSPTNLLMWAHYAASYSGICLGIRSDRLGHLQPVKYQIERPVLHWLEDVTPTEKVERGLFTKSILWKYENEWRTLNDANTTVAIGPGTVKEIYFGPNCHPDTVERIRWIVAFSGQKIDFWRLTPNPRNFELDKIKLRE